MTEQHQPGRRLLPIFSKQSGRSPQTCLYRCGNACFHPAPNTSDNEYFGDVAARALSRRGMLRGGALGAVVAGVGLSGLGLAGAATATASPAPQSRPTGGSGVSGSALTFSAVAPNTMDSVSVPNGYDHSVVIAWGDAVEPGAPEFDVNAQTSAKQRKQFGYNNDMVWFFPLEDRNRALLVCNHEYTNEEMMFPGWAGGAQATREQVLTAMAAHGLSVVEVERVGDTGEWRLRKGDRRKLKYNRRIHGHTVMELTGPAAGDPLLRTAADPSGRRVLGTFNNCAGGQTPWGTVLTAEENFNQYFGASNGVKAELATSYRRYGITTSTRVSERGWERHEERFDLTRHPNEPHRFGWIVEIDPYDPEFTPRKRTALGRFKHEAANTHLAKDGRVVAYLGDDERFDYLYKFVSRDKVAQGNSRRAREHNLSLLDNGTLYVARFTGDSDASEIDGTGKLPSDGAFDGTGEWIPLVVNGESRVEGMTAAEVLIHTRLAGDKVGATKMDRPEDVEASPKTGAVYVALTNNSARQPGQQDEANPRVANRHGHVLEIVEDGNDAAAARFRWSIPLVCGDPEDPNTYFAGYDKTKVSPISCPDNLAFDAAGNLWISTDGNALGYHDGLFAMPLEGEERGHLKQFATVPNGAECCGPTISWDQRTALIAVQHPGEGGTLAAPSSSWPYGEFPRPGVVAIWKKYGENTRVGS
ncbi:PhoX family protein [Allostreptomyces psammosilenae]|uniref:Channel forming colicins domain-containing protein n=1 Tax=Allostreptomyces psammosilenae TaxID=1892865 RepID=A0A853ACW3_9ACTN|nr:PhoX family phosphatase [Allostreptomyces psammosilenae]NYI08391.1 hypothetical protein [Allostreptomyces psammosilenae]